MKHLVWFVFCASAFAQNCIDSPCSLSLNFPFDSAGVKDTRPGTWGTAAFDDGKVQFTNVPAGYRVRIERVYGDFVAWPHGSVRGGKFSGILFGILATDNNASPYATLSAKGCVLYLQHGLAANVARGSFDVKTHASGLLAADNIMLIRRAIFLNETGASIHMEPSMVVEFLYEKERQQ